MNETDLAWAAGFIDGEGSITITPRQKKQALCFGLALTVGNTVKEPLDRLVSLFGGHLYSQPPHGLGRREMWIWRVTGRDAQPVLKALHGHLSVKQRQATIATVFPIGNRSKRAPLAAILQEECYKAMRNANGVGAAV